MVFKELDKMKTV